MPNDTLDMTERSKLRRTHERGHFNRTTINTILDATPLCHVGYVIDDAPMVTPTLQWREGDRVYWHGSSASRMLRQSVGTQVCLSVTLMDGLVMARSAFHHSANFRSVMLFGTAEKVEDTDEKELRLKNFVEGLYPGRWDLLRPMNAQEVKATTVLSMPIAEGSAKIRDGGPVDDDEDYALPIWAGVIPMATTMGAPIPDPKNLPDLDIPDHMTSVMIG